ncbi:MAG: hypothetical protein H6741_23810 [Alphaproteobacteria bacterium]|nr:hypothetical protein [Alphaproteobacteria bacterium]
MPDTSLLRLVRAYDASFRELMTATPEEVAEATSVLARARALPDAQRDLLDTLLLAVGAGQAVPERFRARVEAEGEPLWRGGFLLPQSAPSAGATIDPRYYAAACRLHPALRRRRPFRKALPRLPADTQATFPPSDARWDAVVVAAALEAAPPTLNKDGTPRRDQTRRLLDGLGEDRHRWGLALDLARATGLARPAAGRLYGFPEARPRALVDPLAVLPEPLQEAAEVLLRVLDDDWVPFDGLLDFLRTRAREVLRCPTRRGVYELPQGLRFDDEGWERVEAPLLRGAADVLHRVGSLDAARGVTGLSAARRAQPRPPMPPGFLLTPDLDILVGAGELGSADHGRLCRIAPYVNGDRVHRHKLTREGVAADMAAGHDGAEAFLGRLSRTGVPLSVKQSIAQWSRSAERLTIFTGVTLVEDADGLRRLEGEPPPRARELRYADDLPAPACFSLVRGELQVPVGEDALSVRSAMARIGRPLGGDAEVWRYALTPRPSRDVESLLETLRRLHVEPELPGELEAAILGANGLPPGRVEEAVVMHLPERAAEALRRDRVAGPMLGRPLTPTQCIVSRADLPALRRRFEELGIGVEG